MNINRKLKTAVAALAIAGAIGAGVSSVSADGTATNFVNSGDCTAYSQLTWTSAGPVAVGQVPCNLRHSTTHVKVSVMKGGSTFIYSNRYFTNSLGTGSLRLTAPNGGVLIRPSGCDNYYALTEATISGVGSWSARSNTIRLCFG